MIIKGAHVLDPAEGLDGQFDIRIADTRIEEISATSLTALPGEEVIDAAGMHLFPGFVDLHVHLREPGQTHKEDIASGSRAAARGGFTDVCCMPNTTPVIDSPEIVEAVLKRADEVALTHVHPIAAITKGMKGDTLNDLEALVKSGACGFSEDGKSVMNASLLYRAMEEAERLSVPIFSHCEDIDLVMGGVMHEGEQSEKLGLPGIKSAVENVIAARDMIMAEETGASLHLCHCSTKESVLYLREAQKKNLPITGECCPHHFVLTDADIPSADASEYKMNPPLRTKEDRAALVDGLVDGALEVISTDHAPHTAEEKAKGFRGSPFGIVGLETSASLAYTYLVKKAGMPLMDMVRRMSDTPAKIIGLTSHSIAVGHPANLVLFDTQKSYRIQAKDFWGKAKNMPYEGMEVYGKVCMTVLDGQIVYKEIL